LWTPRVRRQERSRRANVQSHQVTG
jgi:hypothetical protein